MPEISRFFGIRIAMFFNEHNPPHFHAMYEGRKAAFNIRTLAMSEGSLPPRVCGFIVEWATLHQQELLDDWNHLRAGQAPAKIAPLE
ncbi:MAG TPA: DUF4160 domain-containing protein [Verrucomicrobiae bacterium]|nr:DUF4160 domain-containing protein [Verrucomicrobiae bacterium]